MSMPLAKRSRILLGSGIGLLALGILLGIALRFVYIFQWSDSMPEDASWTTILHHFFFDWEAWWAIQSTGTVVSLWIAILVSFTFGIGCIYAAGIVRPDFKLRPEKATDQEAVFAVHAAAFETDAEARLVDSLRKEAEPILSIVAEVEDQVVGHILFSPASLEGREELRIMGLAPMAVLPKYQNLGIGSALVKEGLAACRNAQIAAVIVLGHPQYYPRFGFCPAASTYGITSDYEVPDGVFLALQLKRRALKGCTGKVHYHPAFASVG
ncbi:MAG: GNAT family N-acetyltransferase [Planctomycetota bacterium]